MCVVSMIVDHYYDRWEPYRRLPPFHPMFPAPPSPFRPMFPDQPEQLPEVAPLPKQLPSAEEIAEFHELLRKAREYDKKNHEPDCESEEKKKKLQALADELGVKITIDS